MTTQGSRVPNAFFKVYFHGLDDSGSVFYEINGLRGGDVGEVAGVTGFHGHLG